MQQINHSPAYAEQHVPNGWGFPTHPHALVAPRPLAAQPVIGGGAAPDTVTRIRWGRLLPLVVAIGVLAFGIWTITGGASTPSAPKDTKSGTVSGGGTSDIDIPSAERAITPPVAATPAATPVVRTAAARRFAARRAAARKAAARKAAARKAAAVTAVAAASPAANAAAATAAPAARTVAGGGAGNQLPVTGLETWIAAIIGILLLAVGIGVHVNAVRIGMTAMLYRRGILLRPIECARLAQDRGLPRLRVTLSNVLHRLLEEPAARGSFVAARVSR